MPPKPVLFFFCDQYNVAFSTLFLHRFRPCLKQQTRIVVSERTPVRNFRIFVYGFASPKKLPGILGGVLVSCYQRTSQTAQLWVTGIISGDS